MKPLHRDPTYLAILYYIERRGKAYPDELAHRLGVSRQAVEYRLRRLTEEGLIERTIAGSGIDDVKTKLKSKLFLLPIAVGLISMGQHIAGGDPTRGVISLAIWMMVGGLTYLLTSR